MASRCGISARPLRPVSMDLSATPSGSLKGALVQSWIHWGVMAGDWPAEHSPHHHSVPCLLAQSCFVMAWQTVNNFEADYTDAGRMLSVRISSRLIWYWGMFWCSAKSVKVRRTRWLSWAHHHHGMRFSISWNSNQIWIYAAMIFKQETLGFQGNNF